MRADLASHHNVCTLAYWHVPLFSAAGDGGHLEVQLLWQALYDNNADLVLPGHSHVYERFGPQTAMGAADAARGIRQFVVGTGGADHATLFPPLRANEEVANDQSFGILQLTLHATSYDWKFLPAAGSTFTDSGSANCH